MFLEVGSVRNFAAPRNFTLRVEVHILQNLVVFVGGQKIAHGLHSHVVGVHVELALMPQSACNVKVLAVDSGFMRAHGSRKHFVIHAGDKGRGFFNVHIKADMDFNAVTGAVLKVGETTPVV